MAGIGQYAMGRSVLQDCNKPIGTYGSNFGKRPLFGGGNSATTGGPTFSDIANICNSGYSRSGSQQNGEVLNSLNSGFPIRSFQQPLDQGIDNISALFNNTGYSGQPTPPRNYSEPSLFPSLNSVNRTEMGGGRVTVTNASSKQAVSNMSTGNNLNTSNFFPGSIGGESLSTNPSSSTGPSRGMTLDPSEFPPILTSVTRSGGGSISTSLHATTIANSQTSMRNYVSVMSKGSPAEVNQLNQQFTTSQSNPPEFSKQDFPALPGTSQSTADITPTSTNSSCVSASQSATQSSSHRSMIMNPSSTTFGAIGDGAVNASHRSFSQASALLLNPSTMASPYTTSINQSSVTGGAGIKLLPNHLITFPKSMICDQFGMFGLLRLIRVGDYDATLNMLAPGLHLSSLHSNWQNSGELHNTFVSPCHESCIGRPQDMDYAVPPEYLIRHTLADRLPDPPMDQLSEEVLFWLFYNCCREEVQLVAARELYQREWRFHKKEQIWLTRCVGTNITTDSNSEQGDYYFWDPIKAQKLTHQMNILYSDLDNAPATFRVSSVTLSASVSGGGGGVMHHHHQQQHHQQHHQHHHQQQQQQQMTAVAAYQLQQQQQQQPAYHHLQSTRSSNGGGAGGGLPGSSANGGVSTLLLAAAAAAASRSAGAAPLPQPPASLSSASSSALSSAPAGGNAANSGSGSGSSTLTDSSGTSTSGGTITGAATAVSAPTTATTSAGGGSALLSESKPNERQESMSAGGGGQSADSASV